MKHNQSRILLKDFEIAFFKKHFGAFLCSNLILDQTELIFFLSFVETENLPVFSLLNSYEKVEVNEMMEKDAETQLYYFGLRASKVKVNETGERNYGHDDEHGGYNKVSLLNPFKTFRHSKIDFLKKSMASFH